MQFSIYLSRKQKIYTVFCHKLILIKIYIVCDHILRYTKLKNFLNLLRIAPHSLANEKKNLQHQSELFTESSCSVLGGISGPMIICSGVPSPPSRIGSCSGGSPIPRCLAMKAQMACLLSLTAMDESSLPASEVHFSM